MEKNKMTLGNPNKEDQMDVESFIKEASSKTKELPRDKTVNLRLNQKEYDKLDIIWKKKGFRSKQSFIQSLVLPGLDDV